jgi:hypothetical protein
MKKILATCTAMIITSTAIAKTDSIVVYNNFSMPLGTVAINIGDKYAPIALPAGIDLSTLRVVSSDTPISQVVVPAKDYFSDGAKVKLTLTSTPEKPIEGLLFNKSNYYELIVEGTDERILIDKRNVMMISYSNEDDRDARIKFKSPSTVSGHATYTYQYPELSYDANYSLAFNDKGAVLNGSYLVTNKGEGDYEAVEISFVNSEVKSALMNKPREMMSARMSHAGSSLTSTKSLSVYKHPELADIPKQSSVIIPFMLDAPVTSEYNYRFVLPSEFRSKGRLVSNDVIYPTKTLKVKEIFSDFNTLPGGHWHITEQEYLSGVIRKPELSTSNPLEFNLGESSNVSMNITGSDIRKVMLGTPSLKGTPIFSRKLSVVLSTILRPEVSVQVMTYGNVYLLNESDHTRLREIITATSGTKFQHLKVMNFLNNITINGIDFSKRSEFTLYQVKV